MEKFEQVYPQLIVNAHISIVFCLVIVISLLHLFHKVVKLHKSFFFFLYFPEIFKLSQNLATKSKVNFHSVHFSPIFSQILTIHNFLNPILSYNFVHFSSPPINILLYTFNILVFLVEEEYCDEMKVRCTDCDVVSSLASLVLVLLFVCCWRQSRISLG